MYVHPVLCCSFPMYRYLLPTYCGEYRGAFSRSPRDTLSLARLDLIGTLILLAPVLRALGDLDRPRESPRVWSRKNSHCYVGVWLYYATFSGPERERARLGAADYKILLYATPKSTIKLTTCNNIFLPQGSTILIVSRPSMRMFMCTCVWVMRIFIKFILSLCMNVRVYTRLYAIRVLLLFFIYIYSTLTRAFSRQPSISLSYIQYVKIYRLGVI